MFGFSEWAIRAPVAGGVAEAGYGNDGRWGRNMVHRRPANSGEVMDTLSMTAPSSVRRQGGRERHTINPICLPTFLGWGQFQRLADNEVDKSSALCWGEKILKDDVALDARVSKHRDRHTFSNKTWSSRKVLHRMCFFSESSGKTSAFGADLGMAAVGVGVAAFFLTILL
jgi:hypothetical protein